ncbi:MAG: Short chain fatty acid transporter [Firmicutes bacterium]|nr:Short chain fatty acid transporter [Bacillota bacterium]
MADQRQPKQEEAGVMARTGMALADWSERWFPDAYVFALIAVAVVCAAALALGRTPNQVAIDFGKGFWGLIPFTMQMAFIVIGGYVVAVAPPVKRLIVSMAAFPKTPKVAVAYIGFVSIVASLISWGFGLIFAGSLMKEVLKRVPGVDYRAIGAAAYLGLGSVWALGFSSSAALLMATKASIPASLYKISGEIPLSLTLFTWQNLVMIVVVSVVAIWICYASTPNADKAKTAQMAGIQFADEQEDLGKPKVPGEYLEYSPILTIIICLLGFGYLVFLFTTKGAMSMLDLNTYNFMFLIVGMLLHWTPKGFLKAAGKSVPMTGGVLLQFPLYAGIFGVLMASGLNDLLAKFFVSVSTQGSLPVVVGAYSAIMGLFLPSGGGKWVVEAPYVLEAANQLKVNLAWMVQVYNAAEALPNFINPFWMLPLLGLSGMKARDLAGFSVLQLIFLTPTVLILLYFLSKTMPYVAPMIN